MTNIPSIELTRTSQESVLKVLMPIWTTLEDDSSVRVDLPLFEMSLFVEDESEIESAIREAVHAFFWASEKYGDGFEKEIEKIGWSPTTNRPSHRRSAFSVKPHKNDVIFNEMMKTGHSQLVSMSV